MKSSQSRRMVWSKARVRTAGSHPATRAVTRAICLTAALVIWLVAASLIMARIAVAHAQDPLMRLSDGWQFLPFALLMGVFFGMCLVTGALWHAAARDYGRKSSKR